MKVIKYFSWGWRKLERPFIQPGQEGHVLRLQRGSSTNLLWSRSLWQGALERVQGGHAADTLLHRHRDPDQGDSEEAWFSKETGGRDTCPLSLVILICGNLNSKIFQCMLFSAIFSGNLNAFKVLSVDSSDDFDDKAVLGLLRGSGNDHNRPRANKHSIATRADY